MGHKVLCCTDNLLVLMVCGVFVSLMGLVLLIIYLVARGITSSLHLVEPPIPTYAAALLIITLGVISIILMKRRHVILIYSSILLSILDLIVCIVHAVTSGLVSIPFLESFSVCVLRPTSAECQCYILGEGSTNSSVIVPGDITKHFTFEDVKSCGSIETALKDFLYTLCILYSFTSLGCIVTGTLSTMLLCGYRQADKSQQGHQHSRTDSARRVQQIVSCEDENQGRNTLNQRRADAMISPVVSSVRGRESTTQATPQGRRTSGSAAATPEGRPVRRSASVTTPHSSSAAAVTPSGSARPQRYNSVAGTSESARQRPRLPLLVRSGYLQSHVNGPRVPVYSVQGSHEAYIALTDLPKLQLPALDQVPAYVREPDLPSYEPPPYSPVPDTVSESPELAAEPPSCQPITARQRLSFTEEDTSAQVHESDNHPSVIRDSSESFLLSVAREEVSTEQSAVSSRDVQQDDESNRDQPETFVTGDIIVHERDVESDHESLPLNDLDSDSVNLAVAGAGRSDSGTDFPPPDILMEAIESARSSMNVTAVSAMEEDGLSSDQMDSENQLRIEPQLSSPQDSVSSPYNNLGEPREVGSPYNNLVHPRDVSSLYNDLEAVRNNSSQLPLTSSSAAPRAHTEQRANQIFREGVQRSESARGTRNNVQRETSTGRSVDHVGAQRVLHESNHMTSNFGHRSRSSSPKCQSVHRSKSLSSPTDRDIEQPEQNRMSMPKDGRHMSAYERDKRGTHTKRTLQSPHSSQERKLEADRSQRRKERARDKGMSSRTAERDSTAQGQGTTSRSAPRDSVGRGQGTSRGSKALDQGTSGRVLLSQSMLQDQVTPSKELRDSKARDKGTSSRAAMRDNKARDHSNARSVQRDSTSTDAENLSDIISLVERVHNTSSAERSSKRKKRKKSGKKDAMKSSKV